jgi:hypothetical protein
MMGMANPLTMMPGRSRGHHAGHDAVAITRLISSGTTEQALLAAVAHLFPDLMPAELSAALQDATEAAEQLASRRH